LNYQQLKPDLDAKKPGNSASESFYTLVGPFLAGRPSKFELKTYYQKMDEKRG